MNTLSDTDERKPRPFVWPVYVTAVIIGVLSLMFLGPVAISATGVFRLYAVYGLFGIVTVVGVVRFRSWGWWSAFVWVAVYAANIVRGIELTFMSMVDALPGGVVVLVVVALVVWPLATRRQLFFPPKPEHEE